MSRSRAWSAGSLEEGHLDAEEVQRVTGQLHDEMREAGRRLDATTPADPELMIRHVFAEPPRGAAAPVRGDAPVTAPATARRIGSAERGGATMVEALNAALDAELAADDRVVLLGEDIGATGGVFRVTAGLQERYGAERVLDTPISESGFTGMAVGMCLAGARPVVEMQFDAFTYPAFEQIVTHAARYRWRHRRGGRAAARGAHPLRRRHARTRAAQRLPRGVVLPHAGPEGP